ncbi:MAG: response regulator [Mariprofundales bacterium]|nr:response regulator [Mariprofundales bacterium]
MSPCDATTNIVLPNHILYIEDDLKLARLLSKQFHRQGITVDHAADGASGLAAFVPERHQAVLIDYYLPDTDGSALLAQFQQQYPYSDTALIIVTGQSDEALAMELLQHGAADYVTKDSDGHYIDLLPHIIQMARRRQCAEHELATQRRIMQTILNTTPLGLWLVTTSGEVRFINSHMADLLGSSSSALQTLDHYYQLLSDEGRQGCQLKNAECIESRSTIQYKSHHVRQHDGHEFDLRIHKAPVFEPDGSIDAVLTLVEDITKECVAQHEREAFDAKMEHVQRLESLGVLAGGIAHDFNNILTAILGNATLIRQKLGANTIATPLLDRIDRSSMQAADLCRQMLDYAGKRRVESKSADLSQLVRDMVGLLEVSIAKNVLLRLNLADQLPLVKIDGSQIQQVIMNLVINASEAIGNKSGSIALSSGLTRIDADYRKACLFLDDLSDGTYAFIEVADTGCGMSKEVESHLFEPFFTTKFSGRGLGMSAVLGIVRSHGGTIKVYSEEKRGSTFKVLLPLDDSPQEQAALEPSDSLDGWQGSGTVLVIDDDETVREVLVEMLKSLGFSSLTADDGDIGIARYQEQPQAIDLVITDLTMPRMGGEEVFTELRRCNPEARVILCSGYDEADAGLRFSGKGLAGFLHKPFQIEDLRRSIHQALHTQ